MNITITGNLGAGKSSVCKELSKRGYEIISAGTIFRDVAAERGISVVELNELAKKDSSIDDLIDARSVKLGTELDGVVFDSRLAWHFVPKSFKVFLLIDQDEAAKRVQCDTTRTSEEYGSVEEASAALFKRAALEQQRFKKLCDINYYDLTNYDLVIESTFTIPEQITDEILRNFKEYQQKRFDSVKIELNTRMLYPTQSFRDFNSSIFEKYYEAEKSNKTCCALEDVLVTFKNGYTYLCDGHPHTFAAIRAGKAFAVVRGISNDARVDSMPMKELFDFEDLGKFSYKFNPDVDNHRAGFYAEFPHGSVKEINCF